MTDHKQAESDDSAAIYNRALAILSRRDHSVQELRQKLKLKGFSHGKVAPVIEKLIGQNLLSDINFAMNYVEYRRRRGFGPLRIQVELDNKGVSSRNIEDALGIDDPVWLEEAHHARVKKFGLALPDVFVECSRQQRFLRYRGFTNEQIRSLFS